MAYLVSFDDVFEFGRHLRVHLILDVDDWQRETTILKKILLNTHEHLHVAVDSRWGLEVETPPIKDSMGEMQLIISL